MLAMKPVRFLGTARRDLAEFPELARRQAGYDLYMVQIDRKPSDFKPLPTVGSGAYELRIRDAGGAFRVVYVAKFKHAVYVLHAFQKKTRKTSQTDLNLAARRYALIGDKS